MGDFILARGKLTEEEIKILKANPYVSDVDEVRIIYTNEFKFHFMKEYNAGRKPTQIFRDAGFDPKILGAKRIERATQRWKESYEAGSLGSYQDRTFRKYDEKKMDYKESMRLLEKQQEEIEKLKEENELLKKKLQVIEK